MATRARTIRKPKPAARASRRRAAEAAMAPQSALRLPVLVGSVLRTPSTTPFRPELRAAAECWWCIPYCANQPPPLRPICEARCYAACGNR